MRQYRAWRETAAAGPKPKATKNRRRTNVRAVALSWSPALVAATTAGRKGQPPLLQVGEPALARFIAAHREALDAEVEWRRQPLSQPISAMAAMPISSRDWLAWLQQNTSTYRRLMATAGPARSLASQRIVPDREYPACARLQPAVAESPMAWRLLSAWPPGFFCIKVGSVKWVVFHVSRGVTSLVLPLHAEELDWELVLTASMYGQYWELPAFCKRAGLPVDVAPCVYKLEPSLRSATTSRLRFRFPRAVRVDPDNLPTPTRRGADANASDGSKSAGFCTDDSDIVSVASEADTGVESDAEAAEAEDSGDDSDDEKSVAGDDVRGVAVARDRVSGHPFVVWSNGCFTLSDNPAWPDVKIRVLPRWCVDEHMGAPVPGDATTQMSKAVTPTHFGESRERPLRAYAVLRSWSIWRGQQRGFSRGSPYRQRIFDMERARLRADLDALGHGGRTGHAAADAMSMTWTPDVFD